MRPFLAVTAIALTSLSLSGCASTEPKDDRIQVVASTSVWADIAQTVGGNEVVVTSLITDDTDDPHDYAAGASDVTAVAKADVLVVNGGGYDDFFSQLVENASSDAIVINVDELADTGVENEHYWYDWNTVDVVATDIAETLSELNPADSEGYRQRAESFSGEVETLRQKSAAIAQAQPDRTALLTEPLAYYLLASAGFTDVTPAGLTTAVESGSEIPATSLRDSLELIRSNAVNLLARNAQTDSTQVLALAEAAQTAEVPVIEFRELLPAGQSYVEWMSTYLDELAALN